MADRFLTEYEVIWEFREHLQDAEARAAEAEAWQEESQRLQKLHEQSVHVPSPVFGEVIRDLENGNAKHALELLKREAVS